MTISLIYSDEQYHLACALCELLKRLNYPTALYRLDPSQIGNVVDRQKYEAKLAKYEQFGAFVYLGEGDAEVWAEIGALWMQRLKSTSNSNPYRIIGLCGYGEVFRGARFMMMDKVVDTIDDLIQTLKAISCEREETAKKKEAAKAGTNAWDEPFGNYPYRGG